MHPEQLQSDSIDVTMKSLYVRDVPDEVHQALIRRAKSRGVSLRRYLIELLTEHVEHPTMDEWLTSVRQLEPVGRPIDAAEAVRKARESDEERLVRGRRRR